MTMMKTATHKTPGARPQVSATMTPREKLDQARCRMERAQVPTLREIKTRLGSWADTEVVGQVKSPESR
jgi:hypothetical protein